MLDVVWMTTTHHGIPHMRHLLKSNPSIRQWSSNPQYSTDKTLQHQSWRNCDRAIRTWWQNNRNKTLATNILFIEYDVLITAPIERYFNIHATGMVGKEFLTPQKNPEWVFWREIERLPAYLQPHACGITPLGVLMISRESLDTISDPIYNSVFEADIFCELRLATIAAHAGIQVKSNKNLQDVHCVETKYIPNPGIYHSIKGTIL